MTKNRYRSQQCAIILGMIAFLRGVVQSVAYDSVIVDVGNIGYGVQMHIRDVSSLKKNQNIEVFISEIIREQAHDLYGFINIEDKAFFEILLKVSGVGPRIALALLGMVSRDEIVSAIQSGDVNMLSGAPGVGKRLAERIVVELKNKSMPLDTSLLNTTSNQNQAEDALISLGFKANDVKLMLKGVDSSLSVEEQIKHALKVK